MSVKVWIIDITFFVTILCLIFLGITFGSKLFHKPSRKVELYLLWEPQAQFAGYYAAQERGFFKEENLDVTIRHDLAVGDSLKNVIDSKHSYLVTQLINYVSWLSREPNIDLVSVISTGCNLGWLSVNDLNSNIARGKIYTWWGADDLLLKTLMQKNGIPLESLSGRITNKFPVSLEPDSASLVMSYNEIALINRDNKNSGFYSYCSLGLPIFEDTLIGTKKVSKEDIEIQKSLVRAIWRGWDWASTNQEAALDIVMSLSPTQGVEHQRFMLRTFSSGLTPQSSRGEKYRNHIKTIENVLNSGLITKTSAHDNLLQTLVNANSLRYPLGE